MQPGGADGGNVNHMRVRVLAILAVCVLAAGTSAAAGGRPPSLPGARSCPIFPATNVWNKPVKSLPVAANSDAMIAAIGSDENVHPDFGSYLGYGIPYTVVSGKGATKAKVTFEYADESDRVGYPMPEHPNQESSGDGHILIVDKDTCRLYELFDATAAATTGRPARAPSGTCAPTACGPTAGRRPTPPACRSCPASCATTRSPPARSATRCASPPKRTAKAHIYPARHNAGDADPSLPPMGLRVRLKASVDISGYGKQARVVLQALKTYGMILADNGSPWFISGASNTSTATTICATSRSSRDRTSRSSTRRACVTAESGDSPGRGTPAGPGRDHDARMGKLALAPAAVAFPVVFCLTYFLCVGRAARSRCRGGRRAAGRDRHLARDRRHGRHLRDRAVWAVRTLRPWPGGWRSLGRRGRRRRRVRRLAGPRRAPRHEVSSNRRAARRLSRRESHQAPPAMRTNGPPTMSGEERAAAGDRDHVERVLGRALERAGLRRRRDRRAATRDEIEREAREGGPLLRRVDAAQDALERGLRIGQAALQRHALLRRQRRRRAAWP